MGRKGILILFKGNEVKWGNNLLRRMRYDYIQYIYILYTIYVCTEDKKSEKESL